jgi:uncharacterized coiled-coil protein SlyX
MPDEDEQKKERSRISVRIGEVQVELEGTYDNIKKLMGKELFDFTKGLEKTKKQLPSSTEITPAVAPKEKTVPPASRPLTTSAALSQPSRVPAIGKTTEKKGQKKIVGRRVAIALGMICIVLVAGLVGAIAVYTPMIGNLESQIAEMENQIAERDDTISSLNSTVSSLKSQISSLTYLVANYSDHLNQSYSEIDSLNSQIASYYSIIYLNESGYLFENETLTQNANTSTVIYTNIIEYAGYVCVDIEESSSNTTYVQLFYSFYEVNYDHNVTVGTTGTAAFPVLPGQIEIIVGNTEPVDDVTVTATAFYYY